MTNEELERIYKAAQVVSHLDGLQAVFAAGVASTVVMVEETIDPSSDVVTSPKTSKV